MPEQDPAVVAGAIADEGAAMRGGKGGMLVALGALGLALIGGMVLLMGGDDERRVYAEVGKKINGLRQANFDQFWGCALQGTNLANIRSNADLAFELNGRAEKGGQPYGQHLRDKCMPELEEIQPQLDTLIVPQDMVADTEALGEATGELRSGTSAFASYLDDPELEYDGAKAEGHIKKIAKAWYDFKRAHGALNKTLKAHLQ